MSINDAEYLSKLRQQLRYDSETGVFTWLVHRGGNAPRAGEIAGTRQRSSGYVVVYALGKSHKAHRLAWLFAHGSWPAHFIDHINGVRDDNRIANLRQATDAINAQNQRAAQRNNRTGLLGADWHRGIGRFTSSISVNGKSLHLGMFNTAEEAHAVYVAAKRQFHEGTTL